MENNDANTDYHKFVRLGDRKWEIVEITSANSYPKSQFDLSPSYTNILKNGSAPLPLTQEGEGVQTMWALYSWQIYLL